MYKYLASSYLPVTDNLFYLNQRNEKTPQKNLPTTGSLKKLLVYKADMLPWPVCLASLKGVESKVMIFLLLLLVGYTYSP